MTFGARRPGAWIALLTLCLGIAGVPGAAQAPAPAPARESAQHVDRAALMRDLAALADPALQGRRSGTPGNFQARAYIVRQFEAIGLEPAGTSGFLQPFTFTHRSRRSLVLPGPADETPVTNAANVLGRIRGSLTDAPWIVVTAHYDHLGVRQGRVHPGADDNASGVAVLLAAARHFAAHRPRHTLVFAALDAEEQGLRGAEALVESIPDIRERVALNINLDMVSRSDRNEIYAAGTYHYPWTRPVLEDIRARSRVRILFGHDRPKDESNGLDDWTTQSDHGAFHAGGVPFVYFGVEDHPDYHKPTDTIDRIDPQFFGDAADMIVEAIRTFDRRLAAR